MEARHAAGVIPVLGILPHQLLGSARPASGLAYAAIVIAGLSLLATVGVGLLNRATAKRALDLAERQEARRASHFDLYMNYSASWRRPAAGDRVLGFNILMTNPTDRASTLVNAELHLTYSVAEVLTTVKVPQLSEATTVGPGEEYAPVAFPASLSANGAVSGWLLFRVPDALTDGRRIERYDVVVVDVHGVEQAIQGPLLREAHGGEAER